MSARGTPLAIAAMTWACPALAVLAYTAPALGAPQASAGMTLGAAVAGLGADNAPMFHLGARADMLFLRERNADMGVGPYVDAATAGFHDLDVGGGAEWLVPLHEEWALALSAGGFVRDGSAISHGSSAAPRFAGGVENTVFLGSRSYNFHSIYGMALGLFAQTRWLVGSPQEVDLVVGAQIDAEILALPFVLVASLFR